MEKLPEGTIVKATLGQDSSIVGEVCGIVNEFPVMGYTYIIRIMEKKGPAVDTVVYPYSCVALPQSCFKLV